MNIRLINSFPVDYEPNPSQEFILSEIDKALEQKKKFIIINAPTATGKSFIAKTIADYSSPPTQAFEDACYNYMIYDQDEIESLPSEAFQPFGTAILTVTKALQDQYLASFDDGDVLKGKANYACTLDENLNCEAGVCSIDEKVFRGCMEHNNCPYFNQRNKTVTNKCAFYTYAMFDSLPPEVKRKEFLVCDEAAELEDELVNRNTFSICISDFRKLGILIGATPDERCSTAQCIEWARMVNSLVCDEYAEVKKRVKIARTGSGRGKKTIKTIPKKLYTKFVTLKHYQLMFSRLNECLGLATYIVEHSADRITFIPYNVDRLSHELFDYADTVILMSATIVNHENFAKTLGIDDYYYIEAKSPLDPTKAPILCTTQFRLNYKNLTTELPKIFDIVEVLCKNHKSEKGIIHTHSMQIQKMVQERFGKDPRFLFREPGVKNEDILKLHEDTPLPTVLVSPSMTHGVDLKGDLGKFQIILKAPYMPMQDERIKRKFKADREWYSDRMLGSLIQASGRCNRLHDDVAVTYIMDGTIVDAIARNKAKLPKYFIDRIQ